MSVFFGAGKQAQRDFGPYPVIPPNSQAGQSGISFSHLDVRDSEASMRKVAVGAAVELLSSLTGQLPLPGFSGDGPSKRPVGLPVFFDDPDGTGHGMDDWLNQLMYSLLLRGNGVGQILARDSVGRPAQVMLAHPDTVSVFDQADGPEWRIKGKKIPAENIWHMRAFAIPGQRLGMSPIGRHAVTIGQGLAASAFGLRWFLDGAHPSAIMQNKDKATLSQETAGSVKAKFLAAIRGTREPLVIGSGWEYTAIQVSAEESQFLDTQKYSSAECARIYGPGVPEVLGYETGGTMTYTNIEQRAIDLLKFSLNKWLVRIERRLSKDMLPAPRYVKFNRAALLETDLLTRMQAHEVALRTQVMTVNEVRDIEDKSPVDWGTRPLGVIGKASLQSPLPNPDATTDQPALTGAEGEN